MQHKRIIEEFEIEMWEYIDDNLSDERKKYWAELIEAETELQQMLDEANETFTRYNDYDSVDLEEAKFNKMIDVAASKKSLLEKLKKIISVEKSNVFPKVAFGSILIIASIAMLILSKTPNPVNRIADSTFSWNDESMENKFAKISTKISMLENEEIGKYYFYLRTKDEWDREIISIDKKINNLFNETNNYEL